MIPQWPTPLCTLLPLSVAGTCKYDIIPVIRLLINWLWANQNRFLGGPALTSEPLKEGEASEKCAPADFEDVDQLWPMDNKKPGTSVLKPQAIQLCQQPVNLEEDPEL